MPCLALYYPTNLRVSHVTPGWQVTVVNLAGIRPLRETRLLYVRQVQDGITELHHADVRLQGELVVLWPD